MVESRAQRVEVTARVCAAALHLLDGRVVERVAEDAARGGDARLQGRPLRESEVEQDDLIARQKLQVLRLDVAVYDRRMLRVQVVERVEELIGPSEHLRDGERTAAPFQHLGEVFARNVLHDEELPLALVEVVADARERRVPKVVEESRLALEGFAQVCVVEESFFQRDGPAEAPVCGDVDRAHAALAYLALDGVAILQDCSGGDHSRLPLRPSGWTRDAARADESLTLGACEPSE